MRRRSVAENVWHVRGPRRGLYPCADKCGPRRSLAAVEHQLAREQSIRARGQRLPILATPPRMTPERTRDIVRLYQSALGAFCSAHGAECLPEQIALALATNPVGDCGSQENGSRSGAAKPPFSLVLLDRIELSTSPLPRGCSTTELQQRRAGGYSHRPPWGARLA